MLTRLLDLLADRPQGWSLAELSDALDASPAAVDGMMTLLVRKGRVVALDRTAAACGACPIQPSCNVLAGKQVRYCAVAAGRPPCACVEAPAPVQP